MEGGFVYEQRFFAYVVKVEMGKVVVIWTRWYADIV